MKRGALQYPFTCKLDLRTSGRVVSVIDLGDSSITEGARVVALAWTPLITLIRMEGLDTFSRSIVLPLCPFTTDCNTGVDNEMRNLIPDVLVGLR